MLPLVVLVNLLVSLKLYVNKRRKKKHPNTPNIRLFKWSSLNKTKQNKQVVGGTYSVLFSVEWFFITD